MFEKSPPVLEALLKNSIWIISTTYLCAAHAWLKAMLQKTDVNNEFV